MTSARAACSTCRSIGGGKKFFNLDEIDKDLSVFYMGHKVLRGWENIKMKKVSIQ